MSKICNNCGNEKEPTSVPYQVVKDYKALINSTIKRLWIVVIILIFLLVGTNIAWLVYESQFETVETTTEEYNIQQDAEYGNNNSIINGGEIVNGEANDKVQENHNQNPN